MEENCKTPDYQTPKATVVKMRNSNVICASTYPVNDPWAGNEEENW